jgi:hypothetical protein
MASDGYQCVTSYTASLPAILRHPLNSGIELAVFVTKMDNANTMATPHLLMELGKKTWQRRRLNYLLQIRVETSVQQCVL